MIRLFGELTMQERMTRRVALVYLFCLMPLAFLPAFIKYSSSVRALIPLSDRGVSTLSIMMSLTALGGFVASFWFWGRWWKRIRRDVERSGGLLCKWCGYDLRSWNSRWKHRVREGLNSAESLDVVEESKFRCPECGKRFEPVELQGYWEGEIRRMSQGLWGRRE